MSTLIRGLKTDSKEGEGGGCMRGSDESCVSARIEAKSGWIIWKEA